MDRARMKLGDKVTIPAVVEEIEYTTMGRISYKVEPLIAWFDADEIEALKQTEIVRCKDCIHCADDWNGNEPMFTCELARCCESVYPDDYCSYGEKQVIGKLNNPDDSLVREDSEACKEQKSKLESDTISRQAAIEAFDGVKVNEDDCTEYDIGYNDGIDFAVSKLSVLPSAQPEKRTDKRTETHACDSISRPVAKNATPTDCNDCIWNTCNYNKIDWEVSEDCIGRQQAIEAVEKQYFGGTVADINPSWRRLHTVIPTEQNEEDILKFYYVESLDEYWIGQRCGTRYYGKWTGNCFTFGYSRYLPWGEHVVAPNTLWKEHTYPSEPKEIPFNEWLQGFLEKECQTERTGEWVEDEYHRSVCNRCGYIKDPFTPDKYCSNCGAKMKGGTEND